MLTFLLSLPDGDDYDIIRYMYVTYGQEFLRYAKGIMGGVNRTYNEEDAVQNMFMNVVKYIKSIPCIGDERELRAYMFSSLNHECHRLMKDSTEYEDIDDHAYYLTSDEDFITAVNEEEDYNRVVSTLNQLDDIYRNLMVMRWVQEIPIKKIAQITGLPVKTVYTRLSRGKALYMQLLEEEQNGKA